jgi:hypothetical protein
MSFVRTNEVLYLFGYFGVSQLMCSIIFDSTELRNVEVFRVVTPCGVVVGCQRFIKSKRMRWAGHVARMEKGRGVYRVLIGRRREDNIKMDL